MNAGRKIGGFRVLSDLAAGTGSQGVVVCAVCERPTVPGVDVGDVVALKLMDMGDDDSGAREKCESRTRLLAAIDHPNIVKYFGCFVDEGSLSASMVVVMECLKGETLRDLLSANPGGLDADRALMIVREALTGLAAAESVGVVHRDVKPSNIFVCRDGSVKLIDFEISRNASAEATASTGVFAGTFDYMAPEFTRESFHGDARSDVFSMGVVFHEALTGVMPYADAKRDATTADFAFLSRWSARAKGIGAIHVKSSVRRILSHADEVMTKALAEKPEERFGSATEFLEALEAVCFRELRNGTKVYRLLRVVGKGGFGEVFKARLKSTGDVVAVKHLLKPAYGDRFRREARVMQQVDDPTFVRFIDYFEMKHAGGFEACLVMEFLPGMPGASLRDAIKRHKGHPLASADVLRAFTRYAKALVTLHSQGIYHRDIKPSNLYYPEDDLGKAAIMDLGIARDANGTATAGQVPGTLDYMPPEVVVGGSRGDAGMDLYALGLCLYEAISGEMAYPRLPTGPDAFRVFYERARSAEPPVFRGAEVESVPGLLELLQEMTAVDPARRIQDAEQVRQRIVALTSAGGALVSVPDEPITCVTRVGDLDELSCLPRGFCRMPRRRISILLRCAVAVAVFVLLAVAVVVWEKDRIRDFSRAWAREHLLDEPAVVQTNAVRSAAVDIVEQARRNENLIREIERPKPPVERPKPPVERPKPSPATNLVSVAVTNHPPVVRPEPVPKTVSKPVSSAMTNSQSVVRPTAVQAPKPMPVVVTNNPPVTQPKPVPKPVPSAVTNTPSAVQPTPAPTPAPTPVPKQTPAKVTPKSVAVIRAEVFVADVKERLLAEPIPGRRDRLQKAHGLINDSRTPELLAVLDGGVEKELSALFDAEWKRVRGIVTNKTRLPVKIDTGKGDVTLQPDETMMVTFDNTWTNERYARVEGYEFVMLPHEQETFEKFTFAIRTAMLVPLPVNVTVPELDPGVTCEISGRSESGVVWIVSGKSASGILELLPGEYEGVYEKPDCQRQEFKFKVEKDKPLRLPQPATWKQAGTFGWIGRGVTSAVNGIKNVGGKITVKSGEESRENFQMAVRLRKELEKTKKKDKSNAN